MGFHEKWTTILNHMNGLSFLPLFPPCSCMSSRFEVVFRAKVVSMPWESACPSQKGKEKGRGYLEGNLHVRQKANATIPLEGGGRTPDNIETESLRRTAEFLKEAIHATRVSQSVCLNSSGHASVSAFCVRLLRALLSLTWRRN